MDHIISMWLLVHMNEKIIFAACWFIIIAKYILQRIHSSDKPRQLNRRQLSPARITSRLRLQPYKSKWPSHNPQVRKISVLRLVSRPLLFPTSRKDAQNRMNFARLPPERKEGMMIWNSSYQGAWAKNVRVPVRQRVRNSQGLLPICKNSLQDVSG